MNLRDKWEYIEYIARERLKNNITERHVELEDIEILGAAGELAARRYFKLPETLHVNFDSGADLYLQEWPIDVKTTHLTKFIKHRFLQWPEYKRVKAPIIVMVGVNLKRKTARLLGYATKEEIMGAPINPERDIPCHEIPVPDLHDIVDLWAIGRYYGPAVHRKHPAFQTQATAFPRSEHAE